MTCFKRMTDIVIILLITVVSSIFYIGITSLPGGLHWENYDISLATGLAHQHGSDFWWEYPVWGFTGLYNIYIDLLYWVTGSRGTVSIVLGCCILASLILIVTYILARQLMDRRGALLTVFFLLCSPSLFLQARAAGFIGSVANTLSGVITALAFILLYKYKRKILIVVLGIALAISYLNAYVSFPFLLYSLTLAIILKLLLSRKVTDLIGSIWIMFSFIISTCIISGLISTMYFKQDVFYAVKLTESQGAGVINAISPILGKHTPQLKVQPFRQQLSATNIYNNTKNMLSEQFVGAVTNYKSYVPTDIKPAVWPFDHLGAITPSVPAVYAVVGILALISIFPIVRKKSFCEMTILLLVIVPLIVIGVFLSYQGRRLLFVLPYLCILASIGYFWLEDKLEKPIARLTRYSMIVIIALIYTYHIGILWAKYARTYQFNHYTATANYIKNNCSSSVDVFVITDKSVFFPGAFYSEVGASYSVMYLSEMYFPIIIYENTYNHGKYGTWNHNMENYNEMISYCNMVFPSSNFNIDPQISRIAMSNITMALLPLSRSGCRLHLMVSLSQDDVREAGALSLDRLMIRELQAYGYKMNQEYISDSSGKLVIYSLEMPIQ